MCVYVRVWFRGLQYYYVNVYTSEAVWEKPTEAARAEKEEEPLPAGWEAFEDEEGDVGAPGVGRAWCW